jgi:hypothetical protein
MVNKSAKELKWLQKYGLEKYESVLPSDASQTRSLFIMAASFFIFIIWLSALNKKRHDFETKLNEYGRELRTRLLAMLFKFDQNLLCVN